MFCPYTTHPPSNISHETTPMFQNKITLITGGTSGIGAEVARQMAQQGSFVYLNYANNQTRAQEVLDQIQAAGGQAELLQADVSQIDQVVNMFTLIKQQHGKLDYLVNNAAIDLPQPFESYRIEDWNRLLAVNLTGKFICLQQAIPLLKKADHPRVVNLASRMAEKPYTTKISAYACAAAGIVMLTKVAAKELACFGIKVNTVSPGLTRTPMTEAILTDETIWQKAAHKNPSQRVGLPLDIAHAIMFLLSPEAD
ncbi:MAG TPA: SDR family oxidoreductase, partial [Candidatus Wirthbacteria bacterium]|nr:SDR family oxidoreductase [Candidatus Wirthbacteria bacterium]